MTVTRRAANIRKVNRPRVGAKTVDRPAHDGQHEAMLGRFLIGFATRRIVRPVLGLALLLSPGLGAELWAQTVLINQWTFNDALNPGLVVTVARFRWCRRAA